eukprot:53548-Prymnesium_polylepis.1
MRPAHVRATVAGPLSSRLTRRPLAPCVAPFAWRARGARAPPEAATRRRGHSSARARLSRAAAPSARPPTAAARGRTAREGECRAAAAATRRAAG